MKWDKLVDRCLLFCNGPEGPLKSLLQEAEQELANKLELYDSIYTLVVPNTNQGLGLHSNLTSIGADHNYHKLPPDYIRDISVIHEGRKLKKMSEDQVYRQSDGRVSTGAPNAYGISGDYIVFDTQPAEGDKFIILYKSLLDDANTNKVLTIVHYDIQSSTNDDYVYLDTLLGSALDNSVVYIEGGKHAITAGQTTTIAIPPGMPDIKYTNMYRKNEDITNAVTPKYFKGSRYTLAPDASAGSAAAPDTPEDLTGALLEVENYRDIAPLIPERFHISLCDYAIAVANAKVDPNIYGKHWTMWELNMEKLSNESSDRDLIYNIREEI